MKKYGGHTKDGKRDGYWETYFKDGQLKSKGHYKDGEEDGLWEYFNKDGTVDKENAGTYRNGKRIKD